MSLVWRYGRWPLLMLALLAAVRVGGRDDGERQPRQVTLALGSPVELAAAGVRLAPFRGLRLMPLPTPRRLTDQQGRELFPPLALWIRDQHIAYFGGTHATLTVAWVRSSPHLAILRQSLVTVADFEKAVAAEAAAPWDDARLGAWVAATAGSPVVEKTRDGKWLRLDMPYQRFVHEGVDPTLGQTFVLEAPDGRRLAFLFRLAPGYAREAVDDTIARVLKSVRLFAPERADGPATKFQQRPGDGAQAVRSAAYEQARGEVIDSLGNLPGWWYVETENYVIKSNRTNTDRTLIRKLQTDIEILRRAYEVFLPPPREIATVSVVTVPDTRAEYLAYVGPELDWSAGVWMPTRKELVISPLEWGGRYRRQSEEVTLRTVYHEAFHQYLYAAVAGVPTPPWFNEGHAMLFEAATVNRALREIAVGENAERLASVLEFLKPSELDLALAADLKKHGRKPPNNLQAGNSDLAALIALDYPRFYAADAQRHYGLAWGLVYFLRKAGHLYPGQPYAAICGRVYESLSRQPDWRRANADAFADVDLAQLERDFRAFWGDQNRRSKARRYELLSDAQYRARREQEAAEKAAEKAAPQKRP